MEDEVSLQCPQQPATDPYPEPDNPVHIVTNYSFKIHLTP
jgi:hypothetical protein